MPAPQDPLTNSQIAELLAVAGGDAKPPLKSGVSSRVQESAALGRRSRMPLSARTIAHGIAGVGPYLERVIRRWIDVPPIVASPPTIRENFFALTQVRSILEGRPLWSQRVKGDLQMPSLWSDGSSSIQEMAEAGEERDYEYIAITDHSKGLKIAGGIDEEQLVQQADEIAIVNESLRSAGRTIPVLRSIEVNLSPRGEVDMDLVSLAELDIVLGCFHSALRKKEDQTERYVAALRNPAIQILACRSRRLLIRARNRFSNFDTAVHGTGVLRLMVESADQP